MDGMCAAAVSSLQYWLPETLVVALVIDVALTFGAVAFIKRYWDRRKKSFRETS